MLVPKFCLATLLTIQSGSGCQAALEAEKFLAEHEGTGVSDGPEADNEVKKGKPEADGEVPEYRSNPLL